LADLLPNREKINSTFFSLAMQNGLSAGIVNPLNAAMMDAYYSFNALFARDSGCLEYIANNAVIGHSEQTTVVNKSETSLPDNLRSAVVSGLAEKSAEITKLLLADKTPLEIIDGMLIPALDETGKLFEEKKLFLPQLLLSAKAATSAFDVIKSSIAESGASENKKGKIILATVKGDVHDIGKNIVKVLLENYGYDVIDLGKDVSPEDIVERAKSDEVKLVGLSALMTTTVPNMSQTIALLRSEHNCRVMVGGAVLTADYAKEIGADFYCKDAMASVRCAEKLYEDGEL
jgi:5-methyltetrahydrofolate--homocysteine methyltransferase